MHGHRLVSAYDVFTTQGGDAAVMYTLVGPAGAAIVATSVWWARAGS
jgi:hypothetical protein